MRIKLTLFLILLNLTLFAYIFYSARPSGAQGGESERLIIPSATLDQTTRIEITGPALEQTWVLESTDGRWRVSAPRAWTANPFAVSRMLERMRFLEWETRFPVKELTKVGQSLADYGLAEPAARIILGGANGPLMTIELGAPTEVGNRLYMRLADGETIHVVPRELLSIAVSNLDAFLDRAVMTIPAFEARGLSVQDSTRGNVRVNIARRSDAEWVFESPFQAAANTDAVIDAIEQLHAAEVAAFVDVDPAQAGLANPELRVVVSGNNRRETLLVGADVPDAGFPPLRYVRRDDSPTVFTVDARVFTPFVRAQEDLRQRRILPLDAAFVNTLEIRQGDRFTTLQKLESGAWQVVYTDANGGLLTLPADATRVNELLAALTGLEAVRFVTEAPSESDLANFGMRDPQRILTVRGDFEGGERVLRLGDFELESGNVYASRGNAPTVFLVRPFVVHALKLAPMAYRERALETLPSAAEIQAFRVVEIDADGERVIFDSTAPATDIPATSINTLRAYLRSFRVDTFVRDAFTDPFQLDADTEVQWRYRLEADVRLPDAREGQARRIAYPLSRRIGGQVQFGGSPQANVIFTLPQDLIDALDPILAREPRPDAELNPNLQAPTEVPSAVPAPDTEPAPVPGL